MPPGAARELGHARGGRDERGDVAATQETGGFFVSKAEDGGDEGEVPQTRPLERVDDGRCVLAGPDARKPASRLVLQAQASHA